MEADRGSSGVVDLRSRRMWAKVNNLGLCASHYKMQSNGRPLRPIRSKKPNRTDTAKVCDVEQCGRPNHARGLCVSHNKMRLRGEPLRPIGFDRLSGERSHAKCLVLECSDLHFGHGYCLHHYNIWRTYHVDPQIYADLLRIQK